MHLNQLDKYVKDCKKLKRDLEHTIRDLNFQQEGGVIRYAVDFSEIRDYVLPDEEANNFFLFLEESKDIAYLLQRYALKRLFLKTSEKLILLAPYSIELNDFLIQLKQNLFNNQLNKIYGVSKEIKKILDDDNYLKFEDIVRKINSQRTELELLSEEERNFIIEFLEKNAYNLLGFLEIQSQLDQPIDVIRKLFQDERFDSLDKLVETDFSLNSEIRDNQTTNRWYESLIAKQGINKNSRLDAIAIAAIEKANQELLSQGKKTKLLLVTRSKRMHDLFYKELKNELWAENLLRHPRVFDILAKAEGIADDRKNQIDNLKEKLNTLEFFLTLVSDSKLDSLQVNDWNHIGDVQTYEFLQENIIKKIKKQWKSKENLAVFLEKPSPLYSQQKWKKYSEKVMLIANFLASPNILKDTVFNKLRELTTYWQQSNLLLGFDLQSSDSQKLLREYLESEKYPNKYVLNTLDSLFSIQFYSKAVEPILNLFRKQKKIDFIKIIESLQQEFSKEKESDYEIILFMSSILGALNKWEFAETYCKLAIDVAKESSPSEDNVLSHEGHFFLAICLRKWSGKNNKGSNKSRQFNRFNRCLESINHLNTAIETKKQIIQLQSLEDPRYLKEKGLQILRLDIYFKEFEHNLEEELTPRHGIMLLEKALELSSENQLKIQIYNNILFYYFQKKKKGEDSEAHIRYLKQKWMNYFDEAKKLQNKIEPEESKWHPSFLDTLALISWELGNKGEEEGKESIRLLDLALASTKPSDEERKILQRHKKDIQKILYGSR